MRRSWCGMPRPSFRRVPGWWWCREASPTATICAAARSRRGAPIMAAVRAHAARGGLVLGVCNGFQILCEAGLLPGVLMRNTALKFICRDVYLRIERSDTRLRAATMPVRWFACRSPTARATTPPTSRPSTARRRGSGAVPLCAPDGSLDPAWNITAPPTHIAGILNEGGNVARHDAASRESRGGLRLARPTDAACSRGSTDHFRPAA